VLASQVAELSRAEVALRDSERAEREARLAAREAQAAECTRLARDLHDSVSQALFSMSMHARTAQLALAQIPYPSGGPLARAVAQLRELAAGALAEMRALIFELRPDAVAEEGLVAALTRQAAAISTRDRLPVVAGVCFALYPAIRPFTDESSLRGAQAFASPMADRPHPRHGRLHPLAARAVGVYEQLRASRAADRARAGLLLTAIGTGLTLPYYGAECFGLHAAGQQALQRHDPGLLVSLTHGIRWEEGIWFIIPGLFLIGVGVILLAAAVSSSPVLSRWAAVPCPVVWRDGAPAPQPAVHTT
jgi:hypothetical protein